MIFRKSKKASEERVTQTTVPEAGQRPAAHETEQAGAGPSILTADAVLEGNLATSGELHIDGTVHGSVQASVIVIGANGAVHGHVVGEEIFIRGRAIGPICGVNVTVVSGGHVEGDILNQTIAIENGAFIEGKIRRTEDPLGEWQRMWYGEEYEQYGEEGASSADALATGEALAGVGLESETLAGGYGEYGGGAAAGDPLHVAQQPKILGEEEAGEGDKDDTGDGKEEKPSRKDGPEIDFDKD